MLLAGALATRRKGSRGHLLKLINPLSVRIGPRDPKKSSRASRKPLGHMFWVKKFQVRFRDKCKEGWSDATVLSNSV